MLNQLLSIFLLYSIALISGGEDLSNQSSKTISLCGSADDNCHFKFEKADPDIDYLAPDIHYSAFLKNPDSTHYDLQNWSKSKFTSLLNEHKEICTGVKEDSAFNKFKMEDLFEGTDSVRVQIWESFFSDSTREMMVVLYGKRSYCIISHRGKR